MKSNNIKITLLLASTLTVMSGATIAASLPQMAEVFQTTPNAQLLSKLVLTIPAIFIVFFSPIFGKLSDKVGRTVILNTCLVLYAVGGMSGFFLNDLTSILIGRALLGIAVAGISTMIIPLVGDLFQGPDREKFIGMQAAFMSLGGVIFISLGGFLAQQNWKFPFLIYAFSIPILFLSLNNLKSDQGVHTIQKSSAKYNLFKPILGVYLIAFLAMVIFYLIPTQIPFLLKSKGIESPVLAGLSIAVATLSSTLVSMNFKKIKEKVNTRNIFIILFTTLALGYFFISLSETYLQILLSLIVSGFGVGLIMPNVNTWLLSITPNEIRGSASGFLTTSLFAGQFLSPIFMNLLPLDSISSLFSTVSICIIIVVIPLVWLLFKRNKAVLI